MLAKKVNILAEKNDKFEWRMTVQIQIWVLPPKNMEEEFLAGKENQPATRWTGGAQSAGNSVDRNTKVRQRKKPPAGTDVMVGRED